MTATIDEKTVRHVADLAMLRLNDAEVKRMAVDLASILEYVRQLEQPDTADVLPTAHPLAVKNVFRADVVTPGLTAEQALHNAPQQQKGFFRVPNVLDQQEA